jgi:hypothetical protein
MSSRIHVGAIMKLRLGLAVAALVCFVSAAPANAALYLYEINAVYQNYPSSITGSFTMDSSIGPASISNVDIHATLPSVSGPFNFSFNGVYDPAGTWPVGYLWFVNQAYYPGGTYFWMGFHYNTSLNDGSYLIGGWDNRGGLNHPYLHQSEISVAGVNDWQGITGEMTPIAAPVPEPSTWAMMILGFFGLGFLAYRRRSQLSLAT